MDVIEGFYSRDFAESSKKYSLDYKLHHNECVVEMAEVSSVSENEGCPSLLPPPPSEKLPDVPAIVVSDTEGARRKTLHTKPKKQNKQQVTNEARRVLDALLKRSLSGSDANPHQSDSSGGPPYEYPPSRYPYPISSLPKSDSYRHKITEKLLFEKMEQLELSLSESQDGGGAFDEPDYVYPQDIRKIKQQVGTPQSSGNNSLNLSQISRCHSPNDKKLHQVHSQSSSQKRQHLPHIHKYGKNRHKYDKYFQHDEDDISSSSTEDYEYTDPNEFLRRKKKSFFRRATERLMHSFRRRKEHPLAFAEIDSPQGDGDGDTSPTHKSIKKKKKGSSSIASPFRAIGKNTNSYSRSKYRDAYATDGYRETCEVFEEIGLQQDVVRTGNISPDNQTHYTDIEQFHQESLKREYKKKSKLKDGHFSDGGRDNKSIFNLIKHIKKRGSFKIKRKESNKDGSAQQRCHSAENLISVRPLNKDQRKLLERYAKTKTHGTGSDSEILAVKSLHEVLSNRIDHQIEHQSPLLSTDRGHQLLREKMQLEEILRPAGKFNFDEPDYDEIEEGEDCVDGFLFSSAQPKPFADRTADEKDVVYEKIAEQLAAIADHYNRTSTKFGKQSSLDMMPLEFLQHESSGSSELEGATARRPGTAVSRNESSRSKSSSEEERRRKLRDPTEFEKEFAAMLRDQGDMANNQDDITPVVREMLRSASYSKFQQIVNDNLGSQPGWNQIAMMFRLTQTAVGLAGMGTAVALQIKENTMHYFEDKFANWIVDQGGWESVVEDTDKDSELD